MNERLSSYVESLGVVFPKLGTVTLVNLSPNEVMVLGDGTPVFLFIDSSLTDEELVAQVREQLNLQNRKLVRVSMLEHMKEMGQRLNMYTLMQAKKAQLVSAPLAANGQHVMH